MVTQRKAPIDFSTFPESDGEPVAETRTNLVQMTDLIYALEVFLAPRVRFAVGGNQFIYYNQQDGRQHVAPDVYVALDVAPGWRQSWQTWREGNKFPEVVFEITSASTQAEDLGPKVALSGRLGAREYYIYDPEQVLAPPLLAYQRVGEALVERPVLAGPAVYSPALGAELRVVGRWLRLIDPSTGEPVPVPQEEHETRLALEARLAQEEQIRLVAEAQARREAQARQEEHEARLMAQEQARQLQQALLEARAELERLRGEAGGERA